MAFELNKINDSKGFSAHHCLLCFLSHFAVYFGFTLKKKIKTEGNHISSILEANVSQLLREGPELPSLRCIALVM